MKGNSRVSRTSKLTGLFDGLCHLIDSPSGKIWSPPVYLPLRVILPYLQSCHGVPASLGAATTSFTAGICAAFRKPRHTVADVVI